MKPLNGKYRYTGMVGLWAVLLVLTFPPHSGWCAKKQPPKASPPPLDENLAKSKSPLHITSDRMEANQADKTIIFEGHVVVQQDDMTITGKRMKVFAAADKKEGKKEDKVNAQPSMMNQVDRIEIEGDVRISQKDKVATADKSVYYQKERKVVLIGNPVVSQGKDSVRGQVITLYLAEGRSVVEGGTTPVQAVLHPARKE